MSMRHLCTLLHLVDPTLPIGGFSHSNGLETYVQSGQVRDATSARDYVRSMLMNNIKYNDAAFVRLSYEAAARRDLREIIHLDEECTALKCAREIREASVKLGLRLHKIFSHQTEHRMARAYGRAVSAHHLAGHYCITFGLYAHLLNIPLEEALLGFYYNAAVGLVSNSVKLVPLGQLEGQHILFELDPLLQRLVNETLALNRAMVGMCAIGFDIHCMQHEQLYSRLYMS